MKLAGGLVQVAVVGGEETLYSEKLACTDCGINVPTSSRVRSPSTACMELVRSATGWAAATISIPRKLIVDWSKPLLEGGLGPGSASTNLQRMLEIADGARLRPAHAL